MTVRDEGNIERLETLIYEIIRSQIGTFDLARDVADAIIKAGYLPPPDTSNDAWLKKIAKLVEE